MKRAFLRVLLIGLVIVMLSGLPLACKGGEKSSTSTASITTGGKTSTASSPAATGTAPKTTGTSGGSTSTGPAGTPALADMKSLASYRLSIMSKVVEGTGAGMVTYMKYEWVKANQAEHVWMEDAAGTVQEVYISIGDKYWMYVPGMGWIEQPLSTTPAAEASDLAAQIKQASNSRFDKKGSETVNNVNCIKYEFEYSGTMETPNLAGGGTIKTDMHSTGNMWVADRGDLPAVMIKSVSTADIASSGNKMVVESEQNLTDIGANITINPPESVMTPPTGLPTGLPTSVPTIPSTTPTSSTSTTTTPTATTTTTTTTTTVTTTPPAEGTPVFGDDFQDELNPAWTWTDPNDDATYDLAARPGWIRFTVPDNNDLANATNYDAPRLLIPWEGDFTIETVVEFDPQLEYQGAGILVWDGEGNFLRYEFGFGGLGGEEKNIAVLTQQDYFLGIGTSYPLPSIATHMTLWLTRKGNRFYASYQQQNRPKANFGGSFVDLTLNSAVQVGIVQISQYNTYTLSADFDYFKITSP
jgi:regulation of enolase protein 1 (concanavalin A-like superfamily)